MNESNRKEFSMSNDLIHSFCRRQFNNQQNYLSFKDIPDINKVHTHAYSQISDEPVLKQKHSPKSAKVSQVFDQYTPHKTIRRPSKPSLSNSFNKNLNEQFEETFFKANRNQNHNYMLNYNDTFQEMKIDYNEQKNLKQRLMSQELRANRLQRENKQLKKNNIDLQEEIERKNRKIEILKQQIKYQETIIQQKGEFIKKMSNFNDQLCLKLINMQSQLDTQRALYQKMTNNKKQLLKNNFGSTSFTKYQYKPQQKYCYNNPQSQQHSLRKQQSQDDPFEGDILPFNFSQKERRQFKMKILSNQEESLFGQDDFESSKHSNEKKIGESVSYLNFSTTKDCQNGMQ